MNKYVGRWLAGSCLVVAVSGGALARVVNSAVETGGVPDAAQVKQRMAGLTVPFEVNTGQEDKRVAFTARTLGGTLFVTRAGQLVHSFPGQPVAEQESKTGHKAMRKRGPGWALTETLVNARPVLRGGAPSATRVSRLIGNDPAQWQPQIATFQTVSLGAAWPGIEVELAARGNNVEKIFTVAPGINARRIAIHLRGAKRLELAADGALIAHTGNGPVSFTAPVAWQDIDGDRHAVRVAYTLTGQRYGFHLGDYNPDYPVVIDPLLQATYLGGSGGDDATSIALDASGNVFVAGLTNSTNFPGTTGGAQAANSGGQDVFVAKLNNGLTTLTQATYLGGSGDDNALALALDATNVYVAGTTTSTNFAGMAGGAQTAHGGGVIDAFVAKLNIGLTTLTQATYLGGSGDDRAFAMALASGNVFVAGLTTSTNLPGTAGGAQAANGGGSEDAFVAKLNIGLTTLTQATYLGGNGFDEANALVLDASGNVFVAGVTASTNFPGTTGGAQAANGGGFDDAFVAKLNNGLTTLTQATYLGGSVRDSATAIALDASGNAFVAGFTTSTNFPGTTGGTQTANGGGEDVFVAKLNNVLTLLAQATYLGGSGDDEAKALVLASGNVFVAGLTTSTNFPGTAGGAQAANNGGRGGDAFVAKLTPSLLLFDPVVFTPVAIPLPPWLLLALGLLLAALGAGAVQRRR